MSGPSLADVRATGQPPQVLARLNDEHWAGRLYMRRVSPYATVAFARLGWSPNAVTVAFMVSGVAAGVVAAVGAHVRSVKEGDEVIVCPSGHCGYCRYCLMGSGALLRAHVHHGRRWSRGCAAGQLCGVYGDGGQLALRQARKCEF